MARTIQLIHPMAATPPPGALRGTPSAWLPDGALGSGDEVVLPAGTLEDVGELRIRVGEPVSQQGAVWRALRIDAVGGDRFTGELGIVSAGGGSVVLSGQVEEEGRGDVDERAVRRLLAAIARRLVTRRAAPTT